MEFQLTVQEQELLVMVLRERQRELLREIARADRHDFRQRLQEREVTLEALLRKLSPEAVGSAA